MEKDCRLERCANPSKSEEEEGNESDLNETLPLSGTRTSKTSLPMASMQGGVKGVLKDAKLHNQIKKEERLRLERERNRKLYRQTQGAQVPYGDVPSVSLAYEAERLHSLKLEKTLESNDDGSLSSTDSFLDDESDDVMKRYMAERFINMAKQSGESKETGIHGRQHRTGKAFGNTVLAVSKDEFVDIVDDESEPFRSVVVHLYEDFIPECQHLNKCLDEIVKKDTSNAIYLKLHALETNPSFDTIALPVLMVYRGGKLIHKFVRLHEEISSAPGVLYQLSDLKSFLDQIVQ